MRSCSTISVDAGLHPQWEGMRTGRKIIEVVNLTVRYGRNTVLKEVSLDVYEGEILVILGGSGSGKSVLVRHMIGLETPASGKVLIKDIDLVNASNEELRSLRRNMGMLFQSSALLGSMTLAENVALPLADFTGLDPSAIDKIVHMKLAMVGLAGYEDHLPSEVSGGMKKRAGIARAMVLDPDVLFLDEPSAGLDPVTSAGIDALIKTLNVNLGTTMIIVTHELESIFDIAQRVIMVDRSIKGIIAEGDPKELRDHSTEPKVRDFFNRRTPDNHNGEK